jgi:hypothetical protein
MTKRSRIWAFGAAGVLVAAGALGAVLVSGTTGELLALVLISLGLVLATSLVFLEVGLSEDRELARERRRRAQPPPPASGIRRPARGSGAGRLDRTAAPPRNGVGAACWRYSRGRS